MFLHGGRERKESQVLFSAFAATSAAVFRLGSASSSIFELNAQQSVSFRPSDRSLFQAPNWEGTINGRYWVKNAHVEPRKDLNVPQAVTRAKPVVVEEFYESIRDDYDKLNKDLGQTWILEKPLLEIGTKALGKLGDINIITIAFSGAKDVTSIESWCWHYWSTMDYCVPTKMGTKNAAD